MGVERKRLIGAGVRASDIRQTIAADLNTTDKVRQSWTFLVARGLGDDAHSKARDNGEKSGEAMLPVPGCEVTMDFSVLSPFIDRSKRPLEMD